LLLVLKVIKMTIKIEVFKLLNSPIYDPNVMLDWNNKEAQDHMIMMWQIMKLTPQIKIVTCSVHKQTSEPNLYYGRVERHKMGG
jgi:hypothetical protein